MDPDFALAATTLPSRRPIRATTCQPSTWRGAGEAHKQSISVERAVGARTGRPSCERIPWHNRQREETTWTDGPVIVRNLVDRLREYHVPSGGALFASSLLVGSVAGLGAVVFRWLIRAVSYVSFDWLPDVTSDWGLSYVGDRTGGWWPARGAPDVLPGSRGERARRARSDGGGCSSRRPHPSDRRRRQVGRIRPVHRDGRFGGSRGPDRADRIHLRLDSRPVPLRRPPAVAGRLRSPIDHGDAHGGSRKRSRPRRPERRRGRRLVRGGCDRSPASRRHLGLPRPGSRVMCLAASGFDSVTSIHRIDATDDRPRSAPISARSRSGAARARSRRRRSFEGRIRPRLCRTMVRTREWKIRRAQSCRRVSRREHLMRAQGPQVSRPDRRAFDTASDFEWTCNFP